MKGRLRESTEWSYDTLTDALVCSYFAKICETVSLEVTMEHDQSQRTTSVDSPCESVFQSLYAAEDVALDCDLQSIFWNEARCVEVRFDAPRSPMRSTFHSGAVPMDPDESLCPFHLSL